MSVSYERGWHHLVHKSLTKEVILKNKTPLDQQIYGLCNLRSPARFHLCGHICLISLTPMEAVCLPASFSDVTSPHLSETHRFSSAKDDFFLSFVIQGQANREITEAR